MRLTSALANDMRDSLRAPDDPDRGRVLADLDELEEDAPRVIIMGSKSDLPIREG